MKNIGYAFEQGWWIGYDPNRRFIDPSEFKFFKELRFWTERETIHLDGTAQHVWVYCPDCSHTADKCPVCNGTGDPQETEVGEHDDKYFEGLENLDEDPTIYLFDY